jgi:hypothetical protein
MIKFVSDLQLSWQSVLLVEEIGVTGETHRPAASHWQTLSYNVNFPKEFIRTVHVQKTETTIITSLGFSFGYGTGIQITIPQINPNLYSITRIHVLKIQKDGSTRTKVITWKPLCLQTDEENHCVCQQTTTTMMIDTIT